MKYYILKAIVAYLKKNCTHIKYIKRIENNTIVIEFNDKNTLYFDLSKGNSLIYKKEESSNAKREYNAPFDEVLNKRFINSKIENVMLLNDDKIICFEVLSPSSYKQLKTKLHLEFTGKYTNIIIVDEEEIVLEALRHIDEQASSRIVKVGQLLLPVPKANFTPVFEEVNDIEELLYERFSHKEQQALLSIKKQKITTVKKQISKLNKLLGSLQSKESLEEESNELYQKANLILSNIYQIKPYEKKILLVDFNGDNVEIELDLNYPTAQSFANNLFLKAKKAKQKAKFMHIEKKNLEEKNEFLNRLIQQIEDAASIDEIEFLLPKKEKNQTKTKKLENYESFFYKGYKILLGKNERENIFLLQNSKASDFWFHLKDQPSCHVIVQNSKKTIPDEIIEKAAQLCTSFSVDFAGNYLVDYTQRRNVKIQHGANVLYNPYETIKIVI
ncbi:MAG: NFACT RNA binding domain-containing protein [Arcobacteraceae bacterium]